MLSPDMTKKEIEEFISKKGDFVAIDHLSRFLSQKNIPLEKKRFCYAKLAELYEKKGMHKEVAKMYHNLSESSIVFSEKIKFHIKEAESYIKAGDFRSSEEAVKKAMVEANVSQRAEIFVQMKECYKRQAEICEKSLKRSQAVRIYEKILEMKISQSEREEIKKKLMNLYEKLGRLREYFSIKNKKYDSKV